MKKLIATLLTLLLVIVVLVFFKSGGATNPPGPEPSNSSLPSPTVSVSVSSSPSVEPSPTPAAFPNADNTGVVAGTVLTEYACPGDTLVVSVDGAVYDSKTFDCNLEIRAQNVLIKNSRVVGSIYSPEGALNYSFRVEDSEISYPTAGQWERTMVGEANFTVLRSEITGGNRGIYCRKNCTVEDSWIHGTKVTGTQHASAVRVSQGATLVHNTLHCDVEDQGDAGCSANLTGYPDFEAIKNNRIEGNLFKSTPGGFCAYGGFTQGKPFSNTSDNATNVVFKDNIFERGSNGKCGVWGAITDFDPDRTGNSWTNNLWSTGELVNP